MSTEPATFEEALGGPLLASVSRSFYLTLKALPHQLRGPISLAYLLARTADTIADTAQIETSVRSRCLRELAELIAHASQSPDKLSRALATDFTPLQSDPAEALLMQRCSDAIAWQRSFKGSTLATIRDVLATIISGQQLDLQRFPAGQLNALSNADELHDYTYRVAGCVGEFWTRLCFTELPNAFATGAAEANMRELGIRFGKGLQLVNILRDIGKDASLDRCYLPEDELGAAGIALANVRADVLITRPVWEHWRSICVDHLSAATDYIAQIQHGTLRYATALPLLLGWHTLIELNRANDDQLRSGVKISRLTVTKVLAQAAWHSTPSSLVRHCRDLEALATR